MNKSEVNYLPYRKTADGREPNTLRNTRNYGLDILRVIAMLFIVAHHLTKSNIWGTVTESLLFKALSLNITAAFIDCFVIVGVNVFFLLSGWLKINLRAGKVVSLLAECWAIGIISVCLAAALDTAYYSSFADAALDAVLFPFTHWFVPAYLLLCLLSPILNRITDNLSGKSALYALIVMLVIFCIVGFAGDYVYVNGMQDGGVNVKVSYTGTNAGYSVIWACVCYVAGRIIRMHPVHKLQKASVCFALYLLCCMVNFAVLCVTMAVFHDAEVTKWYIYCYNNPFTFVGSAFLLCAFANVKVKEGAGRFFAFLSAHTFAVYMIHSDNPFVTPYRDYILDFAEGNLLRQVQLLPLNTVALFIAGIAVSVLYFATIGLAVSRLCRYFKDKREKKLL
ncbi:MAG: acyltransferase [Clostridia bacterium]|nr:acyltransferase [Clostridia bacterium]